MNINLLCTVAKAETQHYKSEYDRLKAEKKKAVDRIKNNYLPNTPLYREELEKVEKLFETETAKLKAEYSKSITEAVEEIKAEEVARVQKVNENKLNKIKAISDIPMDTEELLAVAEQYNAEDDYWCNRLLCNIAEVNGIEGFEKITEASLSVKLNLLDQIADQTGEMIRCYDGDDQKDAAARRRTKHVLFSDSVMNRLEEIWNGQHNTVSDADAVSKAYVKVKTKHTDIEKGLAISNVLRNMKGDRRNLLLCQLAEDKEVSDFAIKLSGYATELEAFRGGKAEEYRKAQSIVNQIASTDDATIRKQIATVNQGNEFLAGLIENESKKNIVFKELVGEATGENNG